MPQTASSAFMKYEQCAVTCCLLLLLFSTHFQLSAALVIPNELPSILSLVYSNIPPIKKGTDSRLGFGFRLGEHADFQVLLELGPQKETRPIGNQDDSDGSSFSKRQVNKRQQLRIQPDMSSTERSATTWLEKWSNDANTLQKKGKITKKQLTNKLAGIPIMPQLPEQTMKQLQMLYKMATSSTTERTLSSSESVNDVAFEATEAAGHAPTRFKTFNAPIIVDELQVLHQKTAEKSKAEITKELMDVQLDR